MGAPAPSGREKIFRRNLQGKLVSASPSTPSAPQAEQGHFWRFGGGSGCDLVVLDRLLRTTSKKGRQTFLRKKVHPQTKSWLRLCSVFLVVSTPNAAWRW